MPSIVLIDDDDERLVLRKQFVYFNGRGLDTLLDIIITPELDASLELQLYEGIRMGDIENWF